MDVFKEYIVKKELTQSEKTSKVLIMLASVALALCFFFLTFGTAFSLFGILFACLSVYFGYMIVIRFFVEYEYILTNADLDIDKITNQSTRKRLSTIDLHTVTEAGKVTDSTEIKENETHIKADANNPELDNYYLRFKSKSLGDAILTFTPSVEFVELIKPFIPRNADNKL